jgi:hypothetical protein
MSRPQCSGCFRKHLSQAIILMDEAYNGYPIHRCLAMGHLAEAESEMRTLNPELAKKVRCLRLKIQENKELDPKKDPDLFQILFEADKTWKDIVSTPNDGITNTRSYQFWEEGPSEVTINEYDQKCEKKEPDYEFPGN